MAASIYPPSNRNLNNTSLRLLKGIHTKGLETNAIYPKNYKDIYYIDGEIDDFDQS